MLPWEPGPAAGAPDVLVPVHVHGVELLLVLLALVLLHVLEHLVSHVLGQDGEHKVLLREEGEGLWGALGLVSSSRGTLRYSRKKHTDPGDRSSS